MSTPARLAGRRRVLAALALAALARTARAGVYEDFLAALRRDDAAGAQRLLARGFDANSVDPNGVPLLVAAVRDKAFAVARVLIQQPRIEADRASPIGETALMLAASHGEIELMRLLESRGGQVNRPGWTPLHYAATAGQAAAVEWLLERSAYIDAESPNRTTPLMMAARHKQMTVLRLLLEQGADPTARNEAGLTAADYLDRHGEREAAEMVRARADAFRRSQGAAASTGAPPAAAGREVERPLTGAGAPRGGDAGAASGARTRLPGERPAAGP